MHVPRQAGLLVALAAGIPGAVGLAASRRSSAKDVPVRGFVVEQAVMLPGTLQIVERVWHHFLVERLKPYLAARQAASRR